MSAVSRAAWPRVLRGRFGVPRFASRIGLRTQFLLAGGAVMALAMFAVGKVVSVILTREPIHNTGAVTALLLNSFLAPIVQELPAATQLAPAAVGRLNTLALDGEFRHRFPHLDIWKPDGTIVYSTAGKLIGRRIDLPPGAAQAMRGEVVRDTRT
jgi:hypothetical protein